MMGKYDFWNEDDSEVELSDTAKSAEVEKYAPQFDDDEVPTLPDKFTKTWVAAQLPKSVWPGNGKPGRPGACTPQLIAAMAEAAKKTTSKRGLSARFGLNPSMWTLWERKALMGEQPYVLWHQCMMHSFSLVEEEMLGNIRDHAVSDWKAAAWYLQRLNRDEYSDKQPNTQISVQNEGGSKVTINRITDDDAMAIAQIMGEIGALPSGDNTIEGEVVSEEDH
jgi:hypothetical protein